MHVVSQEEKMERSLSKLFSPLSMIIHAVASQPAKNAGALFAVNAIKNAVPIIHGPKGCAALRKINSFSIYSLFPYSPCTELNELDLVFGAEKKLKDAIVEAYRIYEPDLIVVIPTCPSDMIGDDIGSAVREAKKEVRCEVIYSTGELIKGRPIGYHDVIYNLFDQLFPEEVKTGKIKDSVNIITFPIHSSEKKMDEMKEILEEIGIRVNRIIFQDTCLRDIYEIPKAELNITDSESPEIRLIKKRLGIPYYVTSSFEESPYGIGPTKRIFLEIARFFKKEEEAKRVLRKREEEIREELKREAKELSGLKTALVGGFLYGMGRLVLELNMSPVLLIYKTYGLESHGISKDAIKRMIENDLKVAEKFGFKPDFIINPRFEEEIRKIKELGVEMVIGTGNDTYMYHREGIRAFDFLRFYRGLRIGFRCALDLAREIRREIKREIRRNPILCLFDSDPYRPDFHPSWIKAERVWRDVTEGADGGCIYG